jgi:hypothetical protein
VFILNSFKPSFWFSHTAFPIACLAPGDSIIFHDKFLTKTMVEFVINTMVQHDFDHSLLYLLFVSLQWQMPEMLASTAL